MRGQAVTPNKTVTPNVVGEYYNNKKNIGEADQLSLSSGQTLALGDVALDTGAIIFGHVTDSSSAALANVMVWDYDLAGKSIRYHYSRTDADGNFGLSGVPIGGAKLRFNKSGYAVEHYDDKYTFGTADTLATVAGETISGLNVQLGVGGTISGTVTNGQGTGLVIPVRLYSVLDGTWTYAGVSSVTGTGNYSFYNVKPGDYKVFFRATGTAYASEWYGDAATFAAATVVNVTEGGTTSGIDAQLAAPEINLKQGATDIAAGGTYGFGLKIVGAESDAVFTIENTSTADTLTLTGLPLTIAGTNADQFEITAQPTSPVAAAGSTAFTVLFHPTSAGDKTAQVSIASNDGDENPYVLNLMGTGTVPPNMITVTSPNGGEMWGWGASHNITWTTTGTIADVKIEYSADNGTNWTTVIASISNTGSYAWNVPSTSSTQGLVQVSDVANAAIYDVSDAAFNIASDGTEPNDDSASAGTLPMGTTEDLIYTVGDIDWYKFFVPAEDAGKDLKVNVRVTSPYPDPLPGNYYSDIDFNLLDGTLGVRGVTISGSDNETLYLPNVASGWHYIYVGYCTTDYADSSTYARYSITLEAGTEFGLGYLSGRVVDGVGQVIEKVFLTLFHYPGDWNTSFPAMTAGAGGYFTVAFLPGTYDLNFSGKPGGRSDSCPNQAPINVVAEYYNHKKAASLADHIGLVAGQTQNLGTVALGVGAIVSGHVTDGGGNPLANIFVGSWDAQGYSSENMALTNATGDYSLNGVPIGGAKIRFWNDVYAHEYYNDKPSFGSGDLLATQAGATIPNINAQLTTGGSISGNVSAWQGTGLQVNVRLYSVLDDTFARASLTSSISGDFSFNRVMPGDYKIFFNAAGTAYASEWHADAASFAQATVISVTEGNATTGIDAQLNAPVISVCCGVGDTAGLISYWKLDETVETTAADSFSGFTGTLTYASPAVTVPTFTAGKVSNALSLSNGQYVTVPSNAALNITGDLTIALWVRPNSIACSGADAAYVLVSKRSANSPTPYEFMIGCGGSLRYEAWPGHQPFAYAGTAPGVVTAGVWQHVAMTRSYSGTIATVTFYVNGVPVGSSSQDIGPTVASSDPVWISRDGYHTVYTTQGSFSGMMDEIAIFNRALTPSEMMNIYGLTDAGGPYCQCEPTPALTVISPNGGETWAAGSSHDITWSSTGTVDSVNIDYSTDNGSHWTPMMAANTTNDGSYAWTVPYAASTQCLVRVRDASNAEVYDVSNAVFNIFSDITEPNNDPATAAELPMGTTDNLIYDGGDSPDIDWYKFFVPAEAAGQDLKVNVRVTSPYPDPLPPNWRGDIDFELLDGALVERGIVFGGSDNETLYLPNVASGWYYIFIGYCTTSYPDYPDHARYAISLETGTNFGVGYLSGRVVDGAGQGIEKVFVTLYHYPGDWNTSFPSMTTGPGGNFTVAFLPGTYDLNFTGKPDGRGEISRNQAPINVVAEYYNDKKAGSLADHVGVTAGQTVNLGDVALDIGAIVSGHVTDGGGNPLANVCGGQ